MTLSLPKISQASLNPRRIADQSTRKYMWPGELEVLVALVKSVQAQTVIEFGCNEGRTSKILLHECPSICTYIGIDVPPSYVPSKAVQRNEVPKNPGWMVKDDPLFHLVLKPRGSLDIQVGQLPICDVAFIDGDHGREAVLHDTSLARACVRPGGLIIWHDYHDLGTVDVRDVLHELRDHGDDIQNVEDTWLAYMRRPA